MEPHIVVRMEPHIVVTILLDYNNSTIKDWTTGRCLNKQIKDIIDTKQYEKEAYGRRTFLKINQCSICEKMARAEDFEMLNYNQFDRLHTYHIVHCRHWRCHVSAVYSMLDHCASINMYILRQPFQNHKEVSIPRSDGSITQGECVNTAVIKRNGKNYVYTYWYDDNGDHFTKLIPLKHYTDVPVEVY